MMLKTMEFKVRAGQGKLSHNLGSLLHGFIMEQVDQEYGAKLHWPGLKPFSQFFIRGEKGDEGIWRINTLNEEAADRLLGKLADVRNICLTHKGLQLAVEPSVISEPVSYRQLLETAYTCASPDRRIKIRFMTPAAFKSGEEYQVFPHKENIFKSITAKWDTFCQELKVGDQKTIDHLLEHTFIRHYHLRTTLYHLEGVKITGFTGLVELGMKGPENLARLASALFAFAGYSGVGIKTALGMGRVMLDENSRISGR